PHLGAHVPDRRLSRAPARIPCPDDPAAVFLAQRLRRPAPEPAALDENPGHVGEPIWARIPFAHDGVDAARHRGFAPAVELSQCHEHTTLTERHNRFVTTA